MKPMIRALHDLPHYRRAAGVFTVREIRRPKLMQDLFRLRRRCFEDSPWAGLLRRGYGLETDGFDDRSRHLGLFHDGNLIGGMRVVCANGRSASGASSGQRDSCMSHWAARVKLPLLECTPEPDRIREYLAEICDPRTTAEAGRFVIAPEFRRTGIASRMVASVFGAGHSWGIETALVLCKAEHEALYSRFGFSRVPGTGIQPWPGFPDIVTLVCVSVQATSSQRIIALSQEFSSRGQIVWTGEVQREAA